MEIMETKLVEKKVVTDILCNKCGESCKDYMDRDRQHSNFNSAIINPNFGYGSVIYDMQEWEVHICESCYSIFESTFKIKPNKQYNAWG